MPITPREDGILAERRVRGNPGAWGPQGLRTSPEVRSPLPIAGLLTPGQVALILLALSGGEC